MSRIGKKEIKIPEKVKVNISGSKATVTGPLGNLTTELHPMVSAEVKGDMLLVKRPNEEQEVVAIHGLTRALLMNMIRGVSEGFIKVLSIVGVGYKAEVKGNNVELALGYSNPVIFPLPQGIKVKADKPTRLSITGIDKYLVGETAAKIRKLRPPEPYKGKGIRYENEIVRKKVGKAAGAVGGVGK